MKNMKTVIVLVSTVLMALPVVFPTPAAGAGTVLFNETFENHSLGEIPVTAETGRWVITVTAPGQAEVTENIGGNTGKCLVVRRALNTDSPSVRGFCISGEGRYEAGNTVTIKWDYYMGAGPENQAEWFNSAGFSLNSPIGAGGFEAVWYLPQSSTSTHFYALPGPNWGHTYVDTGVPMEYSKWMSFEIDMYLDPNNTDVLGGTYDLYVTPEDGVKTVLVEDVPLRDINPSPLGIIRFQIWPNPPSTEEWGGDVVNYWDNFSIEKVATPRCGDMYHNHPLGDVNHDCYVDMIDFAKLVGEWLACTDVNCP